MNIKTTLFLLALLIGVGAYFVLFEKGRETPPEEPGKIGKDNPVFIAEELFPDGVKTAEIRWADGQYAMLTRDGAGKWYQTLPVKFPLNTIRVQGGLVNDAATLRFVEKFIPGQEGKPTRADTLLDKPRVSIRFAGTYRDTRIDTKTNQPITDTKPFDQTIHIGGGLPGSRGYIRINEAPEIYVVNNPLHQVLLNEQVALWRSRTLDVPTDAQADRVMFQAEDRVIEMVKTPGDWMFAPPLSDRIAPKATMALLAAVQGVQVGRFIEDQPANLASFGLDKPQVMISVHAPGLEPSLRTLRIGGPADPGGASFHATWSTGEEPSTVVFTVTRDARARFLALRSDDLRDPRITPIKPGGIVELTLRFPEQKPIQLQKTAAAGWQFLVLAGEPAVPFKPDQEAVSQLIDTLTSASAKYYRPATGRPTKPLATIQLESTIPPVMKEELVFFTPPTDSLPTGDDTPFIMVLRNSEQTGYLVPASKLAPVIEPIAKLRDRQIMDVKTEAIERVAIKRADGFSYEFRKFTPAVAVSAAPQWAMVGHEAFEKEMFDFLLKQLAILRADAWLAEPKPFGENTVELSMQLAGASPAQLVVDLDNRQAKIPGVDGVFVLSEQMKMLLDAEYRPRIVLPLAPGDITQVTITKGEAAKPLTIGKDDLQRYQALSPDGKPLTTIQINPSTAAKLFDALMPLRVWRYTDKLDVQMKDATTTLEVVTRTGNKHKVHIGFKDHPTVAVAGDVWFTLQPEALSRLTAETMKPE